MAEKNTVPKIDISIDGNRAIVKTKDPGTGAIVERTLYTKDLFDSMAQLIESTKERSGPVFGTYGTDYSAVRYWEETRSGYLIMVCEASPSIRPFSMVNLRGYRENYGNDGPIKIKANGTIFTKIHWPYTVMITTFQKSGGNWVTREGYIAWSDAPITDVANHKVYSFALPNTYGSRNGDSSKPPYRICWGGVEEFRKCSDLNVASLIPLFYGSDFNHDLVDGGWINQVLPHLSHDILSSNTSLINGRITEAFLAGVGQSKIYLERGTLAEGLKRARGER